MTHLVYRTQDLSFPNATCGTTSHTLHNIEQTFHRKQKLNTVPTSQSLTFIELFVINDALRVAALGSAAAAETDTIHKINLIQNFYRNGGFAPPIQIILVGQLSLTVDPWAATVTGTLVDSNVLLNSFITWLALQSFSRDAAILFSGRAFLNNVVGLSPVVRSGGLFYVSIRLMQNSLSFRITYFTSIYFQGTMCSTSAGSIVQTTYPDSMSAAIIAHELGHLLGSQHDGTGNSCQNWGCVFLHGCFVQV